MSEGLNSLIEKPVSMSEMLLFDWYAGMALMNCQYTDHKTAAEWAALRAKAMVAERNKYVPRVV